MTETKTDEKYVDLALTLKIDCENCCGLCCVALYCMKTDGFPADKEAGRPCKNLMSDFRCAIHSKLAQAKMKGCLAYDCFGAGQKVTQICYQNKDWKTNPQQATEIFEVFSMVFQLHQMLWYLLDSLYLVSDDTLKSHIEMLIFETEQMTNQPPTIILNLDIEKHRLDVNQVLKKVSRMVCVNSDDSNQSKDFLGKNFKNSNLNGRDFSMALLIAANFEACSLQRTNFLGADLRDANIKNADLRGSIFLTQMQINSAKGNSKTILPETLSRPVSWLGS